MPRLVLDPGHGGRDPGARGRQFGLNEKDVTLRVCRLMLDDLRRSGVEVLMTRDGDVEPLPGATIGADLSHRALLANRFGADLFVSWHYDSSNDPSVRGIAVWLHPSVQGMPLEAQAKRLCTRIASMTGQQDRGVRFGDFAVLRETSMDALLIEGAFISSPEEEGLMRQQDFLRKQATAAAQGICDILRVPYVGSVNQDALDAIDVFIKIFNTKGLTPGEKIAANYAANAVRQKFQIPIEQALGNPDVESAKRMINHIEYAKGHVKPGVGEALHSAVSALEKIIS